MKPKMNAKTSIVDISDNPTTLFSKYDELHEGNELVIHNNYDPKAFYSQLLTEKGNTFSWEYLEKGPELWFVKITKEEDPRSPTLGEMASDYRKASVLKKYGLDFCFSGKKTLEEACFEQNISAEKIERKLRLACLQPRIHNVNYNYWELDFMTDFIVNNHHQYVRESLFLISELNEKALKIHASRYQELEKITPIFQQLAVEMSDSMVKEEQILFPLINFLVQVKKGNVTATCPPGSIQEFIRMMEVKNETVGGHMKFIRASTNNYILPRHANSSYSLLYKWLSAFEEDLQQHVHLENNILFPKAVQLEKESHYKSSNMKKEQFILKEHKNNRKDML